MSMLSRKCVGISLTLALMAAGCDKAQLLAPTGSTVTLTAGSIVLPTGGTTQVTAFVSESSGTPVQNGTMVRFTTNLGQVDPVEVQTSNGYAVASFMAGDSAGVAEVRATSGGIGGTAGAAAGSAASNVVQITIGSAAVETVVLGANPGTVPAGGGTVNLIATVVGAGGRALQGIAVTFNASAGQLGSTLVMTDVNGQATTTLTTDRTTTVTAQAGSKVSTAVTVTPLATFTPTLTATGSTPVPGVGHQWSFTATITPVDASAQPTQFDWVFGDGVTATGNSNTTSHVYTTGSGTPKTVTVTIRLTNGQTVVARTEILLGTF